MQWITSAELVDYDDGLRAMAERVAAVQQGGAEQVWLLEHPPLYTAGTSAKGADLIGGQGFPVYPTGRGGQYTYHGPGQRVGYVIRDLKKHAGASGPDLRAYVQQLEQLLILTLQQFDIDAFTRDGRIGVWVSVASRQSPVASSSEAKIAALGVRVQKWVTSHGVALNVNPNLSHYAGIIPCGIREFGVTSMHGLGKQATMAEVDAALKASWDVVFGE
jgi:lipoyl(octanoyl) transferase